MSNEQSLDFLQNLTTSEESSQKTQNETAQPQQKSFQQRPVYQQNTHQLSRNQIKNQQARQALNQARRLAPALDQQIIPPLQSGIQSQPVSVFTLLASHFSLIGERLKDISTNIETHLQNGDVPNIDRSLDTLLDTILYVSNVLILLFKSIPELEHPESPENVHKELINLAVFHLSAAQIQKVPKVPVKLQEQIVTRPQQHHQQTTLHQQQLQQHQPKQHQQQQPTQQHQSQYQFKN
ncbi:Oidioi.mRNA.OKI2018_I69.XSR.g15027.t1.cds [Oikopleura dioica]|uniref:Oidioi.mRNA.OKI2018_I69.XSR.g15027.t1.cds n=1 Tax=Oikopleura dioica TaxID=34765 RepID=A0ABN7SKL4_OIKDI|nr:Oidioi.mRNA.OKI2018_I69.XSR.g15027.t1.cds [Oikopleura dioica]